MTPPLFGQGLPRFAVVVEDPAWPENGGGGRGAQEHYPTMTVAAIRALPVVDCLADDCHYWLWATDTYLPDAFDVLKARGCRYVRTFSWVKGEDLGDTIKLQAGLGQYARSCHEHLLLGTRGAAAVPFPALRPRSVIVAKRTEHSAKPAEAWDVIAAVSHGRPGPRLELNARTSRPGWTGVGHELNQTIEGFLAPYRS
jgi:N6-adenosine-specific RNA methylase IME4